MPRTSRATIVEETRTALWVRWQALRRNPDYQQAVTTFAGAVRTLQADWEQQQAALGNPPTVDEAEAFAVYFQQWMASAQRIRHCHTVLAGYERFSQWLQTGLTETDRAALDAMRVRDCGVLYTTVSRLLLPCFDPQVRETVAPLARFQQQWGVQFPLPPDLPYAVTPLLISRAEVPVQWTLDATAQVLHLTISLADRPKKRLMNHIEEVLTHCLQAHKGRRLQSRAYYEELFQVYDLHHAGHSDTHIAQHLWAPKYQASQRYGAKNSALQAVHDHLKAATELIHTKK